MIREADRAIPFFVTDQFVAHLHGLVGQQLLAFGWRYLVGSHMLPVVVIPIELDSGRHLRIVYRNVYTLPHITFPKFFSLSWSGMSRIGRELRLHYERSNTT